MSPEVAPPAEPGVSDDSLRAAISKRYADSGGERYGITPERFQQIVVEAVLRYAGEPERAELIASLHVADLVLARACADGNSDLIVFDFNGVHRGGFVRRGHRYMLQCGFEGAD